MKKCIKCKAELEDEVQFCTQCGAKQPKVKECPHCHKYIAEDSTFCPECGQSTKVQKKSESKLYLWFSLIAVLTIGVIGSIIYFFVLPHDDSETVKGESDSSSLTVSSTSEKGKTDEADGQEDSVSPIPSFVGDGYTFDVKGNVKNISYESSYIYEYADAHFDKNGKFVNDSEYIIVSRNYKEQITDHYLADGGGFRYEYEYADDGKVSKMHSPFWDIEALDIVLSFNYDGDNVESISATYRYETGNYVNIKKPETFNTQLKVKILTTDDNGNWLTRRITGEKIELSESGFEYAGEGDSGSMYYSKEKVDFTEKRSITYY